jgi:hypothetical protein
MKSVYIVLLLLLAMVIPACASDEELKPARISEVYFSDISQYLFNDNPTYTYEVGQPVNIRISIENQYPEFRTFNYAVHKKTLSNGKTYWGSSGATYPEWKFRLGPNQIKTQYVTINPPTEVGLYEYRIETEKRTTSSSDWKSDEYRYFKINVINPVQATTDTSDSSSTTDSTPTVQEPTTASLTVKANVQDFYVACENAKYYATGSNTVTVSNFKKNSNYVIAVCKDGYDTVTFPAYLSQDTSTEVTLTETQKATIVDSNEDDSGEVNASVDVEITKSDTIALKVLVQDMDENYLPYALINVDGAELKSSKLGSTFYLTDGDFDVVVTKEGYNAVIESYSIKEDTELIITMEETVESDDLLTTNANIELISPTITNNSTSSTTYLYVIATIVLLVMGFLVYKIRKS